MKKLLLLTGVAVFGVVLCAPLTVFARDGHAQSAETTEAVENARQKAQEMRKNKDARVAEIKQQVEARKAEIKQDACEKAQSKINNRIDKISENAANIKSVIDNKYERVQAFYETGQLTTPDYDTLVAAIELAKANAESSLETLANYEVEVDCTSEEAAAQLDAFRAAASQVKEDLKTYRKDLVALISALQSANSNKNRNGTDEGGSTGDDQSTEENEGEEAESNE